MGKHCGVEFPLDHVSTGFFDVLGLSQSVLSTLVLDCTMEAGS